MMAKPASATRAMVRTALLAIALTFTAPAIADAMERALQHFDNEEYEQALALFRPLAEDGNPRAQFYLGSMYYGGRGVPQDHELEAKWIARSAEQGFPWAQNMLGRMYSSGRGVEQDDVAAHMWFNLATTQGTPTARQARERLQKRMSDEQITEAVRRARDWEAVEE